jgi:uncharacterized repeat protein (TIGR02543 family)
VTSTSATLSVSATPVYTVKFDVDGGSPEIDPQNIKQGNKATKPTTEPTKSGFAFAGWYASKTATTPFDFSTVITAATTIVAKWEQLFTLTYSVNGGTGSVPTPEQYKSGETVTIKDTGSISKTGNRCLGWGDGNKTYNKGDLYKITDDVTLFAVWEPIMYTVKFNSNGGSSVESQTVKSGGNVIVPAAPAKSGNEFAGWYTSSSFTTAVNFTTQTITTNCEFFAKWEQLFTLTYSVNGGTGSVPTPEQYKSGETVTIKDIGSISKAGNRCLGWGDGIKTYNKGDLYKITNNVTLYAVWEPIMYTVKFNSNGGSTVQSQTVQSGGKATEPTAPTKSGNTFAGWYTSSSLTTPVSFTTQTITSDCEFFAKWTVDNVTITLICADGNTMKEIIVPSGTQTTLPASGCVVACFDFMGWSTNSSAAAPMYKDQHTLTPTSSMKLYAVMSPIVINITYSPGVGGTGFMASHDEACGTKFKLPECSFTPPAGKTFKSWIGPRGNFWLAGEMVTAGPAEYHQNSMEFTPNWQ